MDPVNGINAALTDIQNRKNRINLELQRLPGGQLMISTNGPGRITYFQKTESRRGRRKLRAISSDPQLIHLLGRKALLQEELGRLNESERILKEAAASLPDLDISSLFDAMPKHFELLDPVSLLFPETKPFRPRCMTDGSVRPAYPKFRIKPDEIEIWAQAAYCGNTSHLQDKVHPAPCGILCRSKSEVLITDIYGRLTQMFHYDELFQMEDGLLSVDFNSPRSDGRILFHEHFGRRDDAYISKNLSRIMRFAQNGIVFGQNLIITFDEENGSIDSELIEHTLRNALRI